MKYKTYSYRFAEAVLKDEHFNKCYDQVLQMVDAVKVPLLDPDLWRPGGGKQKTGSVKSRKRKPLKGSKKYRYFFFVVDQTKLNDLFEKRFTKESWESNPLVVPDASSAGISTKLKADFKKIFIGKDETRTGVLVEIQFGNMARWYTDVFKFQLSYSIGEIDVAILIVPTINFANLIDENVAYYERVVRELPHAKMSLTLPILVIGVEPDDYGPLRKVYERAGKKAIKELKGKALAIPFGSRIKESETDLEGD